MVALMGASGSGKSTLMNILGCLDPFPTSGRILARRPGNELPQSERASAGADGKARFVFQSFNLLAPDVRRSRMS